MPKEWAEQIKEAQKYSKNKIVANEIEYNLIIRNKGRFSENMESEIIPFCEKNNILVIAHSPLSQGRLAKSGFDVLDELSKKYNKTQAQIALNWLMNKKNIVTIPMVTNIGYLKENLGAIGWKMDEGDIEKLNIDFK